MCSKPKMSGYTVSSSVLAEAREKSGEQFFLQMNRNVQFADGENKSALDTYAIARTIAEKKGLKEYAAHLDARGGLFTQ